MGKQTTSQVLMIRPDHFGYNEETALNNTFQKNSGDLSQNEIVEGAKKEFDRCVQLLKEAEVDVLVVDDTPLPHKPDAVFPNNWITFHEVGAILTYPMFSQIRRAERREDIITLCMEKFGFERRYSLEHYEEKNTFLEGTGSMVLDREKRMVYACLSVRTDPTVLDKFCALFGYNRFIFTATDREGSPIYHTNVMMSLGSAFAVVCLDALSKDEERDALIRQLNGSGKEIISITREQMNHFAGNMLALESKFGQPLLVMSDQAKNSLTKPQHERLCQFAKIISSPLEIIETYGGGSARCMIAEIFLPN